MSEITERQLKSFSDALLEARLLSQQRVDAVGNAEGYRLLLEENNEKIRSLSETNTAFLNDVLKPMWESDELLDDDTVTLLEGFLDSLLVSWPEEDLDLSIHFCVSRKLFRDALKKKDSGRILSSAGTYMTSCYNNLNRVNRVRTSKKFTEFFKKEGFKAASKILEYLDRSEFEKIKDEKSLSIILSYSRFYLALYDTWYAIDETENEERIDGLVRSVALSKDEFYVKHASGYDWKKHVIRCYEHMGQLTENGNQWKMTKKQCEKIMLYMDELKSIWNEDPDAGEQHLPRVHYDLIIARNSYYSGRDTLEEYKDNLLLLYYTYANDEYDMYSVLANLFIPTEYLATVDRSRIDNDEKEVLLRMYRQISGYILSSRGSGSFSFMLEYLNAFLERFIEIPGRYDFEEMVLNILAAMHPESYIYSLQTAHVARCIGVHLIKNHPEIMTGLAGCESADDVTDQKDRILQMLYSHASFLLSGRISVIDTYLTCGRRLLSPEKDLLSMQDSMSDYFCKRHNLSEGYDDILADIVTVSSVIVREYEQGYSVKDLLENGLFFTYDKRPGSCLSSISSRAELYEDISFILSRGKDERYLDLWFKLSDVQKGGKLSLSNMLEGYIMRTVRIRELSAPLSDSVKKASEYEKVFLRQFVEIGEMAVQNKEFLSRELYPLISYDHDFRAEEAGSLYDFCFEMMNGSDLSDIDQGLTYFVSRRLLEDARKKDDPDLLVRCLYLHIICCYEMAHQAKRMLTAGIVVDEYRSEGLRSAKEIWSFAEKDKYLTINEDSRKKVLFHLRYAYYLYETAYKEKGVNDLFIRGLKEAFEKGYDPFYVENTPTCDWNHHCIRSLEYIGQTTECGNSRCFTKEQCAEVVSCVEKLIDYIALDFEKNSEIIPDISVRLMYERNLYYAGMSDIDTYKDILWDIYKKREKNLYDFYSVFPNLMVPLELLISFENSESLTAEEEDQIISIYKSVIEYVSGGKNGEAFALLLEYLSEFIYHFIELEGKFTFEQMGLYAMAALHPPTYIHSLMVGELSKCICRHLFNKNPGLFPDPESVPASSDKGSSLYKLEDFCYHGAVCHDFGKIPMIDTIFVYGRNLLDHEFMLLKHHSSTGAQMLSAHKSTKMYEDIARGHHKWYNNSRGYPEDYDNTRSAYRIFTDIVTVSDCLDAATDTVGRSYTGSKTPDIIMDEIIEGGGTRYNPDIAELFRSEDLRGEVEMILDKVRKKIYKDNYGLLKEYLGE